MSVQGNFGSKVFNYVKIKIEGCDLGPDECMTDEELIYERFNYINLNAYPSLVGDN